MAWTSKPDIDRWFSYQRPANDDEVADIEGLRHHFRAVALHVLDRTPQNSDQSTAIRKLREAMQAAVAAIVCQRRPAEPGPNAYLGPEPFPLPPL